MCWSASIARPRAKTVTSTYIFPAHRERVLPVMPEIMTTQSRSTTALRDLPRIVLNATRSAQHHGRRAFDHNRTQFPTRGAHYAVPCLQCHVNNRFRGTPIQCDACHHNVYLTAQNPPHATLSTDCATCHPALNWQLPSFIPHPYFPIASGARHQPLSQWHSCSDCHQNSQNYPSSYSSYICYNCHTHALPTMQSRHAGVPGYDPNKCYNCHPSP